MVSSSDFTGQSISTEALAEHKFTATADGSSGFSGGASDIVTITTVAETISSGNIATFDGTNLVITAGAYDVWGEALIFTDGTGSHSGLLYWRDTTQPTGTRLGDNSTNSTVSTTGIYGLNSTSIAPTFVIRAGETITLNLINHLSANNQVVQEGSYIHVKEMRGQSTVFNPDFVPVDQTGITAGDLYEADGTGGLRKATKGRIYTNVATQTIPNALINTYAVDLPVIEVGDEFTVVVARGTLVYDLIGRFLTAGQQHEFIFDGLIWRVEIVGTQFRLQALAGGGTQAVLAIFIERT